MSQETPKPGDAVRIDGPYYAAKTPGTIGIIDGGERYGPAHAMVVLNASVFWGPDSAYARDQTEHVSCSGGPCPCVPVADLVLVGRYTYRPWRWIDLPRAGGGAHYDRTVNLWSWKGEG